MNAVGAVCAALGLSASLYVLWHVVQTWRGHSGKLALLVESTDSQSATQRAYVRALPVVAFLMIAVLTVVLIAAAVELEGAALIAAVAVLIGSCCLFLVLVPSVVLFNRPKCVVAPALRDEPGLFVELTRRG